MSSVLVSPEIIDCILSYLQGAGSKTASWERRHILEIIGIDINRTGGLQEFGRLLLRMNAEAIRQRYGSTEGMLWYDHKNYIYKRNPYVNVLSAVKALSDLMYQLAEGHVLSSKIYYLLTNVCKVWAIRGLKEYTNYDQISINAGAGNSGAPVETKNSR